MSESSSSAEDHRDRHNNSGAGGSNGVLNNTSSPSASSTSSSANNSVREVEVTAKQIVDRIKTPKTSVRSRTSSTNSNKDGDSIASLPMSSNESSAGGINEGRKNSVTARQLSSTSLVEGKMSAEQKAVEQLLKAVEKWVQEAQQESESPSIEKQSAKELDNLHWVYSIESYLRSLDTDWTSQQTLTHKIASQLLNWFKQLFHFSDKDKSDEYNSIHPHWDINGGLAAVTQLSLYLKFPNLYGVGYQHFQEEGKLPVIYCSDEMIGQQVCSKIGLPYSCVSVIDFTQTSWTEQFEAQMKSDNQNGRVPLALLMNTAVQNLEKGVKLAESHKVWVHFYGNNVLAYFLKRQESNSIGTSFSLDLTRWLRNPKLPYLTLYKRPEKIDNRILDLCELGAPRSEIMCFTPWFVAHVFGKTKLTSLVNEAIYRGQFFLDMVRRFDTIAVVPNWSTLSDGTVILSTLTFQFNPSERPSSSTSVRKGSAAVSPPSSPGVSTPKAYSPQYLDTLNSWLFHIMERDLKDIVPLEFVFVENRGWNIHADIIRTRKLSPEDEATILATFENHMHVLQATVNAKFKFQKLVEECDETDWINNENQWAGLGAVRYVPSAFRRKKSEENKEGQQPNGDVPAENNANAKAPPPLAGIGKEKEKEEMNHLNAQIVNKLRSIDSAFSLGESAAGEWCVQFGMVTEETDVQELVRLVIATGQEIEENYEFYTRMSELVKKGIHEAEEELRRETEEALWEEGILRRVPIVGTFVSWFSPPVKESGVRGRALNLTQGKVESTENIYKYHMQLKATTFGNGSSKATTEAPKK